jgi:dihydrolipoamide dehydrogenase
MKTFDAIIIGSGQGGTPLSKKLAKAGWKTALVEKQFIGGTCVNYGCTPTKTMIASAKAAYAIANANSLGVITSNYKVDINAIIARKTKVVESFRDGSRKGLEKTENLTLIFGTASFIEKKKLHIELKDGTTEIISADKIFIDVGARPSVPDIEGLEKVPYLDSTTIMELTEIPKHLLIVGGGYVGLEFGQMYRRFGSEVTILQHGERLLPKEDEDIAAVVTDFLKEEGIRIVTNAKASKAQKQNDKLSVTVKVDDKEEIIDCSHLLLAAGRTPNTDLLNLQAAGVETDEKGHIKVNEKLETSVRGIFALGDVKGGPEFTHISYNDYIILADNLLNQKDESIANRMIPYCMFTDPQLGRVGMTEAEARKKGLNIKVAQLPMTSVARAIETGATTGVLKAVVDAETGKILGAAVVGAEGGEIMSLLQMAMAGGITYKYLRDMIFAHPLYAESLNNLFMTLD